MESTSESKIIIHSNLDAILDNNVQIDSSLMYRQKGYEELQSVFSGRQSSNNYANTDGFYSGKPRELEIQPMSARDLLNKVKSPFSQGAEYIMSGTFGIEQHHQRVQPFEETGNQLHKTATSFGCSSG